MHNPKLRFEEKKISGIASRYAYGSSDDELLKLQPIVKKRGYLLKDELFRIARWKAARASGRTQKNSEADVKEITGIALQTLSERARVESLLILDGVGWPMASVILHFYHRDPYPILDYRALWSTSLEVPAGYEFQFWWTYVEFCRRITSHNMIEMRMLDKALWQYSRENQHKRSRSPDR